MDRNLSMPVPAECGSDAALSPELSTARAEQARAGGFVPSHLAVPALRDRGVRSTTLEYVAEGLADIRLASVVLPELPAPARHRMARMIAEESGRLQRLMKALAAGVAVLALAVVAMVAAPAGRAEAAEAPAAPSSSSSVPVYPIVLNASTIRQAFTVVTSGPVPGSMSLRCASVWAGSATHGLDVVGRACSRNRIVTVTATLDGRALPLGRSTAWLVDDSRPWTWAPVVIDARRPSKFGLGQWPNVGCGYAMVTAPLAMYSPAAGRWLPQAGAKVQVQELVHGRWVVVATMTTGPTGVASQVVHLGAGTDTARVVHQADAKSWSATGSTRTVPVSTGPVGVDIE